MSRSESNSHTRVQERIAAAPSRGPQPATRQSLGTDAEGYHHVLDRSTGDVFRFDGLDIERVTPVDDTAAPVDQRLADYWAFVDAQIGWIETRWVPLLAVVES